MNEKRVFPKRLLDTVSPPPASEAKRLREEWDVLGWGVYLGGPFCAPNSWSKELVDAYVREKACTGLAPIYVGQQGGPNFGPWTQFKTAAGAHDGREAVQLARAFGWTEKKYIFLDVESETVDAGGEGLRAYVADWCDTVNSSGLWPAVYCPPRFVPELVGTSCAYVWISAWIANHFVDAHPDSIPGVDPEAWARHRMWQYAGDADVNGWTVDISAYNHWLDGPPA